MKTYLLQFPSLTTGDWLELTNLSLEMVCELLCGLQHSVGLHRIKLYALTSLANGVVNSVEVLVSDEKSESVTLISFNGETVFSDLNGLIRP